MKEIVKLHATLVLYAHFRQFYLQDELSDGDLCDAWTLEAGNDLLATASGIIGIGTVNERNVPVDVDICDGEPNDNFEDWDHVTECGIDIPTGTLLIGGVQRLSEYTRIDVEPGSYRARIYYGALDARIEYGFEGQDYYRVVLWPSNDGTKRVIKRLVPICEATSIRAC